MHSLLFLLARGFKQPIKTTKHRGLHGKCECKGGKHRQLWGRWLRRRRLWEWWCRRT